MFLSYSLAKVFWDSFELGCLK